MKRWSILSDKSRQVQSYPDIPCDLGEMKNARKIVGNGKSGYDCLRNNSKQEELKEGELTMLGAVMAAIQRPLR